MLFYDSTILSDCPFLFKVCECVGYNVLWLENMCITNAKVGCISEIKIKLTPLVVNELYVLLVCRESADLCRKKASH